MFIFVGAILKVLHILNYIIAEKHLKLFWETTDALLRYFFVIF